MTVRTPFDFDSIQESGEAWAILYRFGSAHGDHRNRLRPGGLAERQPAVTVLVVSDCPCRPQHLLRLTYGNRLRLARIIFTYFLYVPRPFAILRIYLSRNRYIHIFILASRFHKMLAW